MGPTVTACEKLHAQKYRAEGESFREAMNRVASALQDHDDHYHQFREILMDMRFMPAGRIQASMGSTRNVTPYNCYVSGRIEDSFVDGEGCIMDRAKEAAATMRMGGGIGYDFSTLRPRGSMIRKLQSRSSGAVSFMDIFNSVCNCVASSGHRRGAQMGVLRVDHPDIEQFIHAKNDQTSLTGFNVSIAVTDEFMAAVLSNKEFPLRWGGEIYKFVNARNLWETIMRSTWDWAEPGVLFIDNVNRMNNLYYCETICATNPCGEQPLPPHGACLLGSFNLTKYLSKDTQGVFSFDFEQFKVDIPAVVRAIDNVVDRALYPLQAQREEALNKRRMGLGITGLANTAECMGLPYGSAGFLSFEEKVLKTLLNESYRASSNLSREKGSFRLFDKDKYLAGAFIKELDEDVKDMISRQGIRNSHLTSIAPTGTISLCADNISSGIEPVFDYSFDRTVIEFHAPVKFTIEDWAVRTHKVKGKRAKDVTIQEHLDVLITAQHFTDSAVSKTCNVPGNVKWEDFKRIYFDAWERGAKGCTTFRIDGKRSGVLESKAAEVVAQETALDSGEPEESCRLDLETGRHECE